MKHIFLFFAALLPIAFSSAQQVPSPKEQFGFNIGDDYSLANYTQTEAYFKKIAEVSNRVKLVNMGLTEEGRNQYMMIISSPSNISNLDNYKQISQRLAHAEDLTDEQAHALAAEGKAVIWIDGGIHSNESETAQQLIEIVYQLTSRTDPETMKILDNVIVLCGHANPDGHELVANWYMKDSIPSKRSLGGYQKLYMKYAEHDDNRDYFALNLRESRNIAKQLYLEWFPQIVYNHHQAVGGEAVVSGPPYSDPFNYVFDPLVITGTHSLGAAMVTRLSVENKPGYVSGVFSAWYNGGLRTTAYFHNMIGLLTEIKGNPAPEHEDIPYRPDWMLPSQANPDPVRPASGWHFRRFIDYSISLNYAVLEYGVHNREDLLYNMYKMGRNSIDRGNRDYWSLAPKKVAAITEMITALQKWPDSLKRRKGNLEKYAYDSVMKDPALRDPRGYILSAAQTDFPNAVSFLNTLIRSGIKVKKATASFKVAGKTYPEGSYIVKTNQAFRPMVLDMFEPQDYPNRMRYPGGPPEGPYDAAGWTLAFEMGVHFDRIVDPFDGPFETIPYGELLSPPGHIVKVGNKTAGYVMNAAINNSFIAANDLLAEGIEMYRTQDSIKGTHLSKGSFYIPASTRAEKAIEKVRTGLGVEIVAVAHRPARLSKKLKPLRIGVLESYGGSNSGWCQWVLDTFRFPYKLVYINTVDSGNLRDRFDALICIDGSERAYTPKDIPVQYKYMSGNYTEEKSLPQLKKFVEAGGNLIVTGGSTDLAYKFGVPIRNALFELIKGQERNLPDSEFYIPGSVIKVRVNTNERAAWGMDSLADVSFDHDRVFNILPTAGDRVRPILWFGDDNPLRSGWVIGGSHLNYGVSAFVASVGAGKLYGFGTDITFRAQTNGVYKLLFNELYSDTIDSP